ncbi:MAG: hypothetical protein DRJ31_08355 [Candidatus Methanomethylicota archaeon]|uniref:Uncharacterized protein n=1 Tax=Thermoproteota archaeon TaxID=2056631 RepID=A0A497ELM6_9CREN|nr:MAG: hypothetical protein DRJ31_08355 [Candidatus Verstraetearchaeota archaeon]
MRFRFIILLLLLASTFSSIFIQPASSISQPRYLENIPKLSPDLIVYHSGHLYVHDVVKAVIAIIDLKTGEIREINSPRMLKKFTVSGDKIILLTSDGQVLIEDLEKSRSMKLELSAPADDLEVSNRSLWISIPMLNLLRCYDLESLERIKEVKVGIASGLDKFSIMGDILWAILRDYKTLMRYGLSNGLNSTKEFEDYLQTVEAFDGGVLIATAKDEVMTLNDDLRVMDVWRLKSGSATGIILHRLGDGRIIYVSPSRWVVGEIEGEEIREIKVKGRIGGASPAEDRIWFTEVKHGKIGWISYSRPPKILEVKVEELKLGHYRGRVRVEDPDNDLQAVNLTIRHRSQLPGVPGKIEKIEMTKAEDDWWEAEFELKPGERVEVSAEALDEAGNRGLGEKIEVEARKMTTATTLKTTTSVQANWIQQNLYLVASSLLLLIPILLAVAFFRAGGRKRRKKSRRR